MVGSNTRGADPAAAATRIVELNHSPIRVMAGPGTGKTTALIRRVARLLEEGADPARILVCTFTRTAAADLRDALYRRGFSGSEEVLASTIHSFCLQMLLREDVMFITGRTARTLMDFERAFLIQDLKDEFGGKRKVEELLRAHDAAWARSPEMAAGQPASDTDERFRIRLMDWLQFHKAMLIGELVPLALDYLKNNPTSEVLDSFDHVLVDEYQDLNRADQDLLEVLSRRANLLIVGDEDQSIYSFRYAHPEGIVSFSNYHDGTHDEFLDYCYRCPQVVVSLANSLIQRNSSRSDRRLAPIAGNSDGEVSIVQWANVDKEATGLAQYVHSSIASGHMSPGDVLVLAPRRKILIAIDEKMRDRQIPTHVYSGDSILADGNAQKAVTLLRLLVNPDDRVALRAWVGFDSPSMRSGAWRRIIDYCANQTEDLTAVLDSLCDGRNQISNTSPVLDRLKLLRHNLSEYDGLNVLQLLDRLFPASEPWATGIREVVSDQLSDDLETHALLRLILNAVISNDPPADADFVRIMTLHKAKGLSARLVIVAGCSDGLIPSIDSSSSHAQQKRSIEEQRRLFYVAITRATETLILSNSARVPKEFAYQSQMNVRKRSQSAKARASRFLGELGPCCPASVTGTDLLSSILPDPT